MRSSILCRNRFAFGGDWLTLWTQPKPMKMVEENASFVSCYYSECFFSIFSPSISCIPSVKPTGLTGNSDNASSSVCEFSACVVSSALRYVCCYDDGTKDMKNRRKEADSGRPGETILPHYNFYVFIFLHYFYIGWFSATMELQFDSYLCSRDVGRWQRKKLPVVSRLISANIQEKSRFSELLPFL